MDADITPPTAYDVILEWSVDRPAWQRDALRRIVQQASLSEDDISDLAALCKAGRGSATAEDVVAAVHLDASHFPANPGAGQSVSLTGIKDVSAVNKLAPSQTLSFRGEGITLVYGDNGVGKSGYGRLLKRACRARHSEAILPDVYAGPPPPGTASATLCYRVGGIDQEPVAWRDTGRPEPQPDPVLSAISVFDADCGAVHLKGKTAVAFRPFGLDVPDELSSACKRVKVVLDAEKDALVNARNAIFDAPPWKTGTAVGKAMAALSHSTEMAGVERLTEMNEAEQIRLSSLIQDLAKDPAIAAAGQRLKADRLKHLAQIVAAIETGTADAALEALASLHAEATTLRAAATLAATGLFGSAAMPEVGGEVWRTLWEAARRYSNEAADPGESFPPSSPGALCVLCHQSLSDEAAARMQRFEAFVRGDTERLAEEAEARVVEAGNALTKLEIRLSAISDTLAEVAMEHGGVARKVRRSLASARLRRHALLQVLVGKKLAPPAAAPSPLAELLSIESRLRAYATELDGLATGGTRTKLEAERDELADRASLGQHVDAVRGEITRLAAIELLEKALSDTATASVTNLGNRIADQVLTPHLRDRFSAEIINLVGVHVRVEMVRSGGQFGSPQYQIRLLARPTAKVADILSEGEQTCVAIAAFLAELATAPHNSALVFDDPITSLDHKWRQKVARRLVAESAVRQVIVFTHDLVFANDIRDAADPALFEARHITRSATMAGIVNDNLPWAAMSVLSRVDDLEKRARNILRIQNTQDEETYKEAVSVFYSRLREAWERALEEVAFAGVILRHRDYIDGKQLARAAAFSGQDAEQWAAAFRRCSDLLTGHDSSQGRNRAAPGPEELLQDVGVLSAWVRALKERQKAHG